MIDPNNKIPTFCLKDHNNKETCIENFFGKWIVLYLYPKDNTQGYTREAIDFTEHLEEFQKAGAIVIGISPDPPKKHKNFIEKYSLRVILLSDESSNILKTFGAWGKKKSYGREYEGVIRTTYLISPDGIVKKIWEKIKVDGYAKSVLNVLKELQNQ